MIIEVWNIVESYLRTGLKLVVLGLAKQIERQLFWELGRYNPINNIFISSDKIENNTDVVLTKIFCN